MVTLLLCSVVPDGISFVMTFYAGPSESMHSWKCQTWISFSKCEFLVSRNLDPWRPMDSRSFVRPSVRYSFPRNPRIRFFSWSCGSITVKKWQFRFLAENSKLALFWPKNGQNLAIFGQKTPFIFCFDLILSRNFFICYFLYEIFLVEYFFNVFVCHAALSDQILAHFRGSCCVKITQNSSKST